MTVVAPHPGDGVDVIGRVEGAARPRARHVHWRSPSSRTIRIDGVEARYLVAGSGAPLLVVASPLLSARAYLPVMRALASWFTVIVVDLPGAGGSGRLEHAWSAERYGAWIVELIARMPLAAPILVGHADAAPLVIEAARLAPDELRAVVLVGPWGGGSTRGLLHLVLGRARDALGELAFTLRKARHLLANAIRHRRTFVEHLRSARRADMIAAARGLRVDTMLAWGDRDRAVPLVSASRLGCAIPRATLVVGHGSRDWLATAPDAFAAALRRFLVGQR